MALSLPTRDQLLDQFAEPGGIADLRPAQASHDLVLSHAGIDRELIEAPYFDDRLERMDHRAATT